MHQSKAISWRRTGAHSLRDRQGVSPGLCCKDVGLLDPERLSLSFIAPAHQLHSHNRGQVSRHPHSFARTFPQWRRHAGAIASARAGSTVTLSPSRRGWWRSGFHSILPTSLLGVDWVTSTSWTSNGTSICHALLLRLCAARCEP